MPHNITIPEYTVAITNEGIQSQELNDFFLALTDALTFLEPDIGTGSPEGIESAKRARQYMDTAGSPGSRLYIKTIDQDGTGDDKVGWELV